MHRRNPRIGFAPPLLMPSGRVFDVPGAITTTFSRRDISRSKRVRMTVPLPQPVERPGRDFLSWAKDKPRQKMPDGALGSMAMAERPSPMLKRTGNQTGRPSGRLVWSWFMGGVRAGARQCGERREAGRRPRASSSVGRRGHTDGRPGSCVRRRRRFLIGSSPTWGILTAKLRSDVPETSIWKWRKNEEQMALGLWLRERPTPKARAAWRHQRPIRPWAENITPVRYARRSAPETVRPIPRARSGTACGNSNPDELQRVTARLKLEPKRGYALSASRRERSAH